MRAHTHRHRHATFASARALAVALVASLPLVAATGACFIAVPDVVLGASANGDAGAAVDGSAGSPTDGGAVPVDARSSVCVDGGLADPRNCGACGHDCQGGACSGGTCQPYALQPTLSGPYRIAVDDAHVYWTDWTVNGVFRGEIGAVGNALTMALGASQGASTPWAIAVDEANVYWTNAETSGGSIYRCPKTGCAASGAVRVARGLAEPTDIVVDGADLYVVEHTGGTVKRVSKAAVDGSPVAIVTGLKTPEALLLDGARLYWSDSATATSHIAYAPKSGLATGAPPMIFASGLERPNALALSGDAIAWTDRGPPSLGSKGSLEARPKPGAADAGSFVLAGTEPYFLATSGDALFWTDRGAPTQDDTGFVFPNGTVRTCTRTECASGSAGVRVIAIQQAEVQSVVATADAVYWATSGVGATAGTIMKVVRYAK